MYNTLIRWCLAGKPLITADAEFPASSSLCKGKVVSAASTGIAALLLLGGGTVHRQFNVPNDVDYKTAPRMNAESLMAERIRNSDLIIIDVCIKTYCFLFL